MVPNGSKWYEMVQNGSKGFIMVVVNRPNCFQSISKDPKGFKYSKWFQLALISTMTRICVLVYMSSILLDQLLQY